MKFDNLLRLLIHLNNYSLIYIHSLKHFTFSLLRLFKFISRTQKPRRAYECGWLIIILNYFRFHISVYIILTLRILLVLIGTEVFLLFVLLGVHLFDESIILVGVSLRFGFEAFQELESRLILFHPLLSFFNFVLSSLSFAQFTLATTLLFLGQGSQTSKVVWVGERWTGPGDDFFYDFRWQIVLRKYGYHNLHCTLECGQHKEVPVKVSLSLRNVLKQSLKPRLQVKGYQICLRQGGFTGIHKQ